MFLRFRQSQIVWTAPFRSRLGKHHLLRSRDRNIRTNTGVLPSRDREGAIHCLRKSSTLAAALSLIVVVAVAQEALPQGVQKKATLAGLTEYSFPNGLRVVLFPDASSPKITVNM